MPYDVTRAHATACKRHPWIIFNSLRAVRRSESRRTKDRPGIGPSVIEAKNNKIGDYVATGELFLLTSNFFKVLGDVRFYVCAV